MTPVQTAARDAYAAGLSIVPPAEDGSKRPAPNWPPDDQDRVGTWAPYMKARPSQSTMRAWYGQRTGLGVICGAVSGNLEVFEFDDRATYDAYLELARQAGMGALLQRLEAGYVEDTPSGGVHWLYRCPATAANTKLACRPLNGEIKTLIETRGEGGFCILAPSTGRVHRLGAYVLRGGGFKTIPTVTPDERRELHQLARTFDEMPQGEHEPAQRTGTATPGGRPGDDFNRRSTWDEVLKPAGWTEWLTRGETTYWRRPGKDHGNSATTNRGGSGFLIVFSTSTPFKTGRAYSRFGAYGTLNHAGDFAAAAADLAAKGYGSPTAKPGPARSDVEPGGLALTGLSDLLAEPDETVDYIVDDRIAFGSVNLLSAKPKAGKSTMARVLSFEVARGGWFLGSRCLPRPVWYLALEEKRSEVRRHFRRMGATGAEPIRFLFRQPSDGLLSQLHRLAEREHPGLIVVDTLQRLIRAENLNDYAEVTTKLTPILSLARETGAAVLLVHHAGKSERAGIDAVLGSTALTGSVDNVFLLCRTDRFRVLSSVQRIGPDLPETVITLDPETGLVQAGATRHDADRASVEAAILAALKDAKEAQTEAWLESAIEARTGLKREALRALVQAGRVTRTGGGGKGDPFHYLIPVPDAGNNETASRYGESGAGFCSLVPSYSREQENKNPDSSQSLNACGPDACSPVPGTRQHDTVDQEHASGEEGTWLDL